jgi:hypothetical protein
MAAEIDTASPISATVQMGLQPMVRGYVLANRRLHNAVERSHAFDIYAALFEVSHWIDSLSERDTGLNGRDQVQAVKFARNRSHHEWASAVQNTAEEWTWRPLENLPIPEKSFHRNAKLEPIYQQHLEGTRVVDVFDQLEPFVVALAADADLT